jgi:hypothetical protein
MHNLRRFSISLLVIVTTMVGVCVTISSLPSVYALPPNPIAWAEKAPIPYATAQAGVIGGLDGRIYVMGGYDNASVSTPISSASVYDPRTNSWSSIASLPTATRGPGIAVGNTGLIYVISGYSGSGDITNVQVYNATGNAWAAGTPIPTAAWMPGATTGIDGRIYVAGGEVGSGPSSILQIYNPSTKTWSSGASMTTARRQFQLVSAPNGLIYAIGGNSGTGATANVEAYNITSNTWTAKASLPSAVAVFGATLGPDGLIYVFGGSNQYVNNSSPYYNTVYSYDPTTNTWYTNTQTLPTARRELSAATSNYNHRMYVVGGANGTYLTTNEEATVQLGDLTTTTVTCSPASVVVNNSTQCTATVTDTNSTPITPTGTVTFTSSSTGTFSGTCTLSGTGASASCMTNVTYTPTVVAPGSHVISGTYGGDSKHSSSTSIGSQSFTLTVTGRSTATTLSCSPSTVLTNNGSTCTTTVTDTASGTASTPTGTVQFTSSGTASGTFTPAASCSLTTGSCSVIFTPTSAGTATVTGNYQGDNAHSPSSGTSGTITSTLRTTSIAMSCHPSRTIVGNLTSCAVTVTDTSPSPALTPTGTITLSSSGTGTFTSCMLAGSGAVATCSTNYTPKAVGTGLHTLTAHYGGDAGHSAASPDAKFNITVTSGRSVTASLSCAGPAIIGSATNCTVTVTDNSPGTFITPTGLVTLTTTGSGTFTGPCTLSGTTATATCTVTYTPSGTSARNDIIGFNYPGDTNHTTSSGNFLLVVDLPTTSPGGTNAQPVGFPTSYWIILAVALAGLGLFTGYLALNRKKKQTSPNPAVVPRPPAMTPPSATIAPPPNAPSPAPQPPMAIQPTPSTLPPPPPKEPMGQSSDNPSSSDNAPTK